MTKDTVLLCTVGGSHQPILTALREIRPAHVLFFCSGKDPATGRPGSCSTITGKGHPIQVRSGDKIDHLPNLRTLAGLADDRFGVHEIPPDDLDEAVTRMLAAIADARTRFPDAAFVADYTGGTKTMTAALVMASLDSEAVELQLVTGTRADLVRVRDGTQAGLTIGAEGIRIRRGIAPYLAAWQRYAYGEAADGLSRLRMPRDPSLRGELLIARDLSAAFDAWDRFDHTAALAQMDVYRARIRARAAPYFSALKCLAATPEEPKRRPAQLWDLWLNAQRRARQARYDDAVARAYRLLEWTAQWLLKTRDIDTGDLRAEDIPAALEIPVNANGKRQTGLHNAWALAAHHLGGDVRAFVEGERGHMLDHLLKRNGSILAHGETPVRQGDWEAFAEWIEAALVPLLRDRANRAGLKVLAPQLPQSPPW